MLPATYPVPTTAERIRSACARAGGALLAFERAGAREDPVDEVRLQWALVARSVHFGRSQDGDRQSAVQQRVLGRDLVGAVAFA